MKYNYELFNNRINLVSDFNVDESKPTIESDLNPEELCNGEYGIVNDELTYLGAILKTNEEIVEELRLKRETECFPYINRGELWYSLLTEDQLEELKQWYRDWLNVTETLIEPTKPEWLI